MFADHHNLTPLVDRSPRPDRRPIPSANEIRMRVRREMSKKEA